MNDTLDVVYVLLFDGLDQLSELEAKDLYTALCNIKSSKVRIVMTGTEETFHSASTSSGKYFDSTPNIRLADHNKEDIKNFIDSEVREHKILQGPGITGIVNLMRERLSKRVDGNFYNVKQVVDEVRDGIDSGLLEDRITEIINETTLRNKDTVAKKLIDELSKSLKMHEIEQLDELLGWTIFGVEVMSVSEIRAVLFLHTKSMPLQSLEDKVAQKFSKVLKIDEEYLTMRDADLYAFFRTLKRKKLEADLDGVDDPKISMTISIEHVKLSKVQRFLWDLSEKVVFDRFGFIQSSTGAEQNLAISVKETEGHLIMVKRCFDLLQDEQSKETKTLSNYAMTKLPIHLGLLRDESAYNDLRLSERAEVIGSLVYLLRSSGDVGTRLTENFFQEKSWLVDERFGIEVISMLRSWLRDSEVASKLSRKDRNWVRRVSAGTGILALNDLAKVVTRQWLSHREWPAQLPFQWIDAFLEEKGQDPVILSQVGETSKALPGEHHVSEGSREKPPKVALSYNARVIRATAWAENDVEITTSSVWYERLGDTHLHYQEYDASGEAYLAAKDLPNPSWKIPRGLAEVYAGSGKMDLAVQEMEIVFTHLRGIDDLSADDRNGFIHDLVKSATWQTQLNGIQGALDKLNEAVRLDEYQYQTYFELLNLLIEIGKGPEALRLLSQLAIQPAKEPNLTKLAAMFLVSTARDDPLEYIETVFRATTQGNMFQVMLEGLQIAITFARESKAISQLTKLLFCYGVAIARYSTEEARLEAAVMQWKECCRLGFQSEQWWDCFNAIPATRCIFNCYFSEARSTEHAMHTFKGWVAEMATITKNMRTPWAAIPIRLLIGSFHSKFGAQDEAHDLLLNDVESGMDLLSDDDPDNDYMGYKMIASILMHTGDELNALSAWSLYGPSERYESHRDVSYNCDGRCNKPVTWANMCDDVQFHDECLEKLRQGTLQRFVCSSDHEWLRVPSWMEEYKATGKDHVRAGGELRDGERVGGQIVPVVEWLDLIREKWGIEKPKPVESPEDGKQDN